MASPGIFAGQIMVIIGPRADNERLLHLQPKGSWAFPAPEGPEYALEPEGWKCNNDILLP